MCHSVRVLDSCQSKNYVSTIKHIHLYKPVIFSEQYNHNSITLTRTNIQLDLFLFKIHNIIYRVKIATSPCILENLHTQFKHLVVQNLSSLPFSLSGMFITVLHRYILSFFCFVTECSPVFYTQHTL